MHQSCALNSWSPTRTLQLAGACLLLSLIAPRLAAAEPVSLELGYRQMYNLDFSAAHHTFAAWKQAHPDDPLGPVSDAAAYLFSEFDRLHVLEIELFADNTKFLEREKPIPDRNLKSAFESELAKSAQLAEAALAR